MTRLRHSAVATLVAASIAVSPALATTASAEPEGVRSQVRQLIKDIDGKDRRLDRISGASRTTRLADDHEAVLVDSITADRADLATLRAEAEAADSTYDARAVRRQLRTFRVENYGLATNIVRRAEQLTVAAAADPAALALVDAGLAAALALTADSTKADVRAARQHLAAAQAALDGDVDDPADPAT